MNDLEEDNDDDVAVAADPPPRADVPTPDAAAEPEEAKKPDISPLEATIMLARRGNKKILPTLRRTLEEHPELWQHFGNLALQAQESWLQLIAGKDLYLSESLRLHLDSMRAELAGQNASPLDKLLVDRILAAHVQVLYFEAVDTADPTGENNRVARFRMDRRDQAHRQFLSAIKMLATVRNLVARTNVIQVELLAPTTFRSPATANVSTVNGMHSGGSRAPVSPPATFNGSSRFSTRMPGAPESLASVGAG
jgi:hypothetical protein